MNRVRTRFAPSPTGELHAGNVRIAVLNWLVARHHDGDFVLRIEDTDIGRNVAEAEAGIMADLRWLGLDWDEGPDIGGPHAPYRQSERVARYADRTRSLLEAGRAYRCFCSPDTLQAAREAALAAGESPRYPGTCRTLEVGEAERRADAGEPYVLRLRTPSDGEIVVEDAIRGTVVFAAAEIGDFVILRPDGLPTYNFAVVVDDAAMAISHVVRGAGHLSNTPHQLLVYRAIGAEPPVFAHAPTVLGDDRSKLSKRSGARPLRELREEGLHPDAVVNYLSLLGWSSPSGEEVLSRDRLIDEISLDRINAGDAVFDPTKLRWLSAQHIDRMPLNDLYEATRGHVEGSRYAPLLDGRYLQALEAVRSHLSAFSEVVDHLGHFVGPDGPPPAPESDAAPVLESVRDALEAVQPWTASTVRDALKAAGKRVGARGRDLYVPVRQAVTGEEHGPPLAAVITVQGRDRAVGLLEAALRRARNGV
ncbi:MAG: glutamate--tRNA ligase [Candidatus Longimicrobiales bacterium M2_2A_002]